MRSSNEKKDKELSNMTHLSVNRTTKRTALSATVRMAERTAIKTTFRSVFVAAMLALLLTVSMFGCAQQSKSSEAAKNGTDAQASAEGLYPITFVLDYTPNTNHTGIYVAQALGYYAEAGLDVRVVQPPEDGADAMVATGQAQFGMTYQDFMANYLGSANPLPVTAVAAVVQHNTSGIISAEAADIKRPRDLQGKRYGTWDQPVEQAIVRAVVEEDGGSFQEVELIPSGMSDEVNGLRADLFDAIWCFEGWGGQNAVVQGLPVNYFSFKDIDSRFDYYTPVIIANDAFLESDPEVVRTFLAATERGYAYAAEHPQEAAQILADAVPELDPALVLASQEYLSDEYIADAPQWGYIDKDRWNAFYRWMNDEGLTDVELPLDTAFTNDYLPGR